jgi:putative endonuclease
MRLILEMNWTVYIIRSESSGTYYRGSCEDFEKRLAEHNAGKTRSTKAHRPWVKVYTAIFDNKTDALKREKYFKTRSGYRWLKEHGII